MFYRIHKIVFISLLLLVLVGFFASAQQTDDERYRLSFNGGVGISGARGSYAKEYLSAPEFSFYPGIRFRMNETFLPSLFLMADLGYLETGFVGYVTATDSNFFNTYTYLATELMLGTNLGIFYFAGGFYLGIGLDAYSYREITDSTVVLDSNTDFGIVAEAGIEPWRFLSIGIQPRLGLSSIGSSVDIKNLGLLATITVHFLHF